jgi:hypothetical protein
MIKVAIVVGDRLAELLYADDWDEVNSIRHTATAVHDACAGPGLRMWASEATGDVLVSVDDDAKRMVDVELAEVVAEVYRRIGDASGA